MTEQEIFFEAIDIPDAQARAAFTERACGSDHNLHQKVQELLREHFSEETLLASAAVDGLRPTISEFTAELEGPGSQIGRYKLLQKLGEGGFGIVYMAEQKDPVKRRVALKIIKLGMDTRQVVARFEAERQALALMDHPNIAKVLDAGATDTGRPYFVMELVRGVPITKYCDDNSLNTRDRLLLFIAVCNAIQHAHQKGIIHRDIKPTNVLVTLHDGVPVPKVIDFGIAKATQQELTEKTLFTQFNQFIGTPAYMSPEQAEMSGLDIDTRSDVYSLGVLLYELLVGRTPLDSRALISSGYDEIRRRIKEEEPPKPSTRVSTLNGEERTCVAKRRGIAPEQLSSELRGDLDWIVLKALEKDRQRRYETASGFASDIRRFLDNDPVLAAPPSRTYLLRKYVRRHKGGLLLASSVALILVLATVISAWQAWRATQARQAEIQQRQLAEARQRKAEAEEKRADREALTAQQTAYASQMLLASTSWEKNNPSQLRKILLATAENPQKGPEWFFWQKVARLELKSLKYQYDPIGSLKFSPEETVLASGSETGAIALWNVASGERLHVLSSHAASISCLEFSEDGKRLASGDSIGRVAVWDVLTGKEIASLTPGTKKITSILFAPDGTRLATCSLEGSLWIWDPTTGKVEAYPPDPKVDKPPVAFEDDRWSTHVRHTSISPDFRTLMTGYGLGHFTLRSRDNFSDKAEFQSPPDGGYIFSAKSSFVGDGSRIILTGLGGRVDSIDVATRKRIGRWKLPEIATMDITPDGSRIAIATYFNRTPQIWDLQNSNLVASFKGHSFRLASIAIAPSGNSFASGDVAGNIKVWSADSRRESVKVKGGNTSLYTALFSKDGQRVVTSDWKNQTRVWDASTGKKLHNFETAAPSIFFPDNRRLLTTTGGFSFGVNGPLQILDLETEQRTALIPTTNCVHLDISADGKRVLVANGTDTAEIWNAESLRIERSIQFPSTNQLFCQFSPRADQAVCGGSKAFYIWDTSSGEILKSIPIREDQSAYACAAYSSDNKWIATGQDNGSITLWDAVTGERIRDLEFHSGKVTSVGFSPDCTRILSSSFDGSVKLWDAKTGMELFSLEDECHSVVRAAMSSDGRRLLHAGADEAGIVSIWTIGTPQEAELWLRQERELEGAATKNRRQGQ